MLVQNIYSSQHPHIKLGLLTQTEKLCTLQTLHSIQLGQKLVYHSVGNPGAVVAPPGGQRVKLVKEQDARAGSLSPKRDRKAGSLFKSKLQTSTTVNFGHSYYTGCKVKVNSDLWKTSRTACSLAPMYLLKSSGPYKDSKVPLTHLKK